MSLKTTPVATLGPALVTVTMYSKSLPRTTGVRDDATATRKSAAGLTWMLIVDVLLDGLVSILSLVTVAVSLNVPAVTAWTTTCTLALELTDNAPRLTTTCPFAFDAFVAVEETKASPDTMGKVTLTLLALCGPLFVAEIV